MRQHAAAEACKPVVLEQIPDTQNAFLVGAEGSALTGTGRTARHTAAITHNTSHQDILGITSG